MKRILSIGSLFLMLFLSMMACDSQPAAENNPTEEQTDSTANAVSENEDKTTDEPAEPEGFVVEGKAFLILNPTKEASEKAVAKIKEEHGEDALGEIGSDVGFYLDDATTYAEKQGLKVYSTDETTILFKKEDGSIYKMENKIEGIGADCFLFDGKKDPVKVKTIPAFSDGEEYKAYYK